MPPVSAAPGGHPGKPHPVTEKSAGAHRPEDGADGVLFSLSPGKTDRLSGDRGRGELWQPFMTDLP